MGAAAGTTASYLSDIVENGKIYCLEYSEKSLKKLKNRIGGRENVYPILGDARKPDNYKKLIGEVDFLYQDITQRNQAEIFQKNADLFLNKNEKGVLIVKTKNIDLNLSPEQILKNQKEKLNNFRVIEEVNLEPNHSDHWALFLEFEG